MDQQPNPELNNNSLSLYKGLNYEAVLPVNPKIDPNEGTHIEITSINGKTSEPRDILKRLIIAEGVAKAIAEGGGTKKSPIFSQEFWSNVRIVGENVSVYGRNLFNPNSWRRPVDTNSQQQFSLQTDKSEELKTMKSLFGRYLKYWENLANSISLFEDGVNGLDQVIDTENVFTTPFWTNGRIEARLMQQQHPTEGPWKHLDGWHVVIAPIKDLKYKRQWQTVTSPDDPNNQQFILLTTEAAAVSLGIQTLLGKPHGEIHNSGNWAQDLKISSELIDPQKPEKGMGMIDVQNAKENPKEEKRSHFTRISIVDDENGGTMLQEDKVSDIATASHFHVYIPFTEEAVKLPEMFPKEAEEKMQSTNNPKEIAFYQSVIKKWKLIQPQTENEIKTINELLGNGKLTQWLEENCRGTL